MVNFTLINTMLSLTTHMIKLVLCPSYTKLSTFLLKKLEEPGAKSTSHTYMIYYKRLDFCWNSCNSVAYITQQLCIIHYFFNCFIIWQKLSVCD